MSSCKQCKYEEDDLPRCETCGEGYMNFEPIPADHVTEGVMSAEEYYLSKEDVLITWNTIETANNVFKFATDYAAYVSEIKAKEFGEWLRINEWAFAINSEGDWVKINEENELVFMTTEQLFAKFQEDTK